MRRRGGGGEHQHELHRLDRGAGDVDHLLRGLVGAEPRLDGALARIEEDLAGEGRAADGLAVHQDLGAGDVDLDGGRSDEAPRAVEEAAHGLDAILGDGDGDGAQREREVLGRVAGHALLELEVTEVGGDVVALLEVPRGFVLEVRALHVPGLEQHLPRR